MYLQLEGLPRHLQTGWEAFAEEYGFTPASDGLHVTLTETDENLVELTRTGDRATIRYHLPVQIFRALGLLQMHAQDTHYHVRETCYFPLNCVMIDVSQAGALPTLPSLYRLMRIMACMGLNGFMLYMEDCYEVEGEPYFGYMRPRYTQADLRAVDDYADALGIEVIPCIQTLAHLTDALRWEPYHALRDDESTLLVGDEKTYVLLEHMIRSAVSPFRSRRLHIGSDEAWRLGQGEYLLQHGYEDKYAIMCRHLPRVMEIVRALGRQPMMWGDMFFRAILPNNGYYTQDPLHFPPEMLASIPPEMQIIYWDYYSNEATMAHMMQETKKFNRDVIYAGCVRNNRSFAYSHAKTLENTQIGLRLAKANGIGEVIATVWGDNCPESSIWSILLGLQLYAEHGYAAEVTQETWYTRFAFCAKASGESFEALKLMDELPEVMGKDGNLAVVNTSRFLLFQDPLLGLLDANLPDGDMLERHYTALGADMTRYARDFPAHAQMFSFYASACHALALKSTLGLRLHAAYQAQDTAALCTLRDTRIPNTLHAVEALCNAHRALFLQTNKPVGWEVRDLRYGGLIQRLKTCQVRVADYLAGKTDALDELREKQLPYNGHAGLTSAYLYHDIVSASRV